MKDGREIVVFGAGEDCAGFIENNAGVVASIKYIIDNNSGLWFGERYGIKILCPEELRKEDPNKVSVVVAMGAYFQVIPQIKEYGAFPLCFFHAGEFHDPYQLAVSDFKNVLLRIETTSRCNLSCTFCTHVKMKRRNENMEQALYERVVCDAGSNGFKTLDIRNFGEPLLDKKLEERVHLAKDNGLEYVFLFTNAVLLNNDKYNSLARAGLDKIIVSISPSREYNLTRAETSYTAIIENLKSIQLVSELAIQIDVVAPASSLAEVEACISELRELGFESIVNVPIHNWGQKGGCGEANKHGVPCRRLWNSLTVLSDGRVALCCIDSEGEVILGDAREQSLAEIFNSERYIVARRRQVIGNLPRICRDCNNFR